MASISLAVQHGWIENQFDRANMRAGDGNNANKIAMEMKCINSDPDQLANASIESISFSTEIFIY